MISNSEKIEILKKTSMPRNIVKNLAVIELIKEQKKTTVRELNRLLLLKKNISMSTTAIFSAVQVFQKAGFVKMHKKDIKNPLSPYIITYINN
jgi:Fe2+ or Zn2+ uptake regulation protein